jgi:hypothetical protein
MSSTTPDRQPVLRSPGHAVVGATDVAANVAFLAAFGFDVVDETSLSADASGALYGLDAATHQVLMQADGRRSGAIRLVATTHPAPSRAPFDRGPLVLDLYTTAIEASRDVAAGAGADIGHLGTIELGPLVMRQVMVTGPDDLRVVLVEANHRRPSLLDDHPERPHSELHSVLWAVDTIDEAAPFWTDEGGLIQAHVFPVGLPVVSRIMGLPREDHELRMNLLVDDDQRAARVELFEFSSDPGGHRPTWPLRGGLHALGFDVDDLDAAMRALPSAAFGAVTTTGVGRAVTAVAPAGVRFELWERH